MVIRREGTGSGHGGDEGRVCAAVMTKNTCYNKGQRPAIETTLLLLLRRSDMRDDALCND